MLYGSQDAMVNRQLSEALQLYGMGRISDAKAIYERLTMQAPRRVEPLLNLGQIAYGEGAFETSLTWFQKACALRPELPDALVGAGRALLALGRPTEALAVFEKCRARNPRSDETMHGIGDALSQLGRMAEARAAFEHAVALAPDVAGHHCALAQVARFKADDPRLAGLEKFAATMARLPPPTQCELHFALGKAYDDLSRHDEAFAHWKAGNAIKRRYTKYDEAAHLAILKDLAAAFPAAVMAARRGAGDPSELPVFVVGMPRSGTSLVEQIIASHPKAHGAGEFPDLHLLISQNIVGENFPAHFAAVPDEALARLGALYVTHLKALAPEAGRIVDKLPFNFMVCGLIHLALPAARIIHVRRDPLDTCLSCYANLFSHGVDYSYDLSELGRTYRGYAALMDHWRTVLPEGTMLEVQYEELVADFEPQARRIVAYCGLDWDARCLAFHNTERVVHTLSAAQVRQPLYRTAVGRAAPYRPWLTPLIAALGG